MSSEADIYADVNDLWEITPSEKEISLYFGHSEVQPNKADQLSGLPMGQLMNEQKSALIDLLEQYQHLFAWESTQLGRTDLVRHTIDVGGAALIKKRWYRTSRLEREFISTEIDRML
ncbi:unnamed protein product [Rhizophagus irregularis]|nr:unnamed protein product [Rhizophagus irregularis]CAB5374208.1 unnamed protein product [Rhizophagus irregularis]